MSDPLSPSLEPEPHFGASSFHAINRAYASNQVPLVAPLPPRSQFFVPSIVDGSLARHPWPLESQNTQVVSQGLRTDTYSRMSQGVALDPVPQSASGNATSPPSRHPVTRRRAKAHVEKACTYCQRKHLACDDANPCKRCQESGLEDECVRKPHRKRGRPPNSSSARHARAQQSTANASHGRVMSGYTAPEREANGVLSHQQAIYPDPFTRTHVNGYRQGPSNPPSIAPAYYNTLPYPVPGGQFGQPAAAPALTYPAPNELIQHSIPTAFLCQELNVIQMNNEFQNVAGSVRERYGNSVIDLVENEAAPKLLRFREEVRRRLGRRPAIPASVIPPVDHIDSSTLSYEHQDTVILRLRGQSQSFDAMIGIAHTHRGPPLVIFQLIAFLPLASTQHRHVQGYPEPLPDYAVSSPPSAYPHGATMPHQSLTSSEPRYAPLASQFEGHYTRDHRLPTSSAGYYEQADLGRTFPADLHQRDHPLHYNAPMDPPHGRRSRD